MKIIILYFAIKIYYDALLILTLIYLFYKINVIIKFKKINILQAFNHFFISMMEAYILYAISASFATITNYIHFITIFTIVMVPCFTISWDEFIGFNVIDDGYSVIATIYIKNFYS